MNNQNLNSIRPSVIVCIALLACLPAAYAQDGAEFQAPFVTLMNSIINLFTGVFARSLATLAVIGLGLAAMIGRLTWTAAIRVIVGIVLIFGAASVVKLLTGGQGPDSQIGQSQPVYSAAHQPPERFNRV
ncbi:TrbC/VirB2 family protein [Variovorax sp. VNK109]|jgi:type IV secretory pathway VirB2 component (pilin)|uniref:TrbC/VirB2 family protein n=1 Tax=Variovorax sp. VNK109 TaxID=3400919 RepID=UPI003C0516AC